MWPCIQKDSSTLHWNRKSNCHLHASRESLFLVIYQNDFSNKKLHKETTKLLWLLLLKPQYFPTQAKNNFCEIDILLKYSPFIIFFVSYVTTSITKLLRGYLILPTFLVDLMLYFENTLLKITQWNIQVVKARMCIIRTCRRKLAVLYESCDLLAVSHTTGTFFFQYGRPNWWITCMYL